MNKAPHKQANGMVDVGDKQVTKRIAIAKGFVRFSANGFYRFLEEGSPKGDVLEAAKIAGVMAAKKTPDIIPLCHPLSLSKTAITFSILKKQAKIEIRAEVHCSGKTGVEMEALHAVSAAALTIYDMMKWADKEMVIEDVCLYQKSGGQSGDYIK